MALNFLNSIPIFSQGTYVFTVGDKNFGFIFDYFESTLLGVSKRGSISFRDFRTVLLSAIYVRLYSNRTSICGLLLNQTAGYGLVPGINKLVNLLPLNGVVNIAGFVLFRFVLADKLVAEVEAWSSNNSLFLSLLALRRGLNYDRIVFEPVNVHIKNTVTYNSFICNVNPDQIKASCGDVSSYAGVETVLCVPAYVTEMTLSLAVTILFYITVPASNFLNVTIALGAKYMNIIDDESQENSLVVSAMICVFGNDNVNFGRSNYVTEAPGNRVDRAAGSERRSHGAKNERTKTPPAKAKDSVTPPTSGTPPETNEVVKSIIAYVVKLIDSSKLAREDLLLELRTLLSDKQLILN